MRDCITAPLPGVTSSMALLEPTASVSRNMTPAFTQEFALVSLTTRAVIESSPLGGWYTNWNASAIPQIAAHDPLTVNVPLLSA